MIIKNKNNNNKIKIIPLVLLLLLPIVFAFDMIDYPNQFIFNRSIDAFVIIGDNGADTQAALNVINGLKLSEYYTGEYDKPNVLNFRHKNPLKKNSEITNLYEKNVIILGGPCANDKAARLMGVNKEWPECNQGFKQDFAKVKLYKNYDRYQLLIAGYETKDTLSASKMFVNFTNYDLVGKGIEVNTYSADNPKINRIIYE